MSCRAPIIAVLVPVMFCAACFPLVRDEGPPDRFEATLLNRFADAEQVLVLPFWESVPVLKTDTSGGETLFVEQLFVVPPEELPELPAQVDEKTTAMLIVGAGAAVGRGVEFHGFLLIADDGLAVWVQSYGTSTWHGLPETLPLAGDDLAELSSVLGEMDEFERHRAPLWSFLPHDEITLDLDDDARQAATAFLSRMSISSRKESPSP